MEITSVNNALVKETTKLQQKKYRQESGKFLLEGYKAIKEAFDFGIELENIFADADKIDNYNFAKEILIKTNSAVLKKLSTTATAPEAVAVGVQKTFDIGLLKNMQKVILLENIKDSGNLGTILRSAVAFGFDAVILYGDCIDLYNPKCVRASVGNLWKIPVYQITGIEQIMKIFGNFDRIATLPRAKNLLNNFEQHGQILVMFGSEADGLSDELINFSTNSVKIEMANTVESLNLSISAAIIMYKLSI